MKNLLIGLGVFAVGFGAGLYTIIDRTQGGELVYDGDDMYVKAEPRDGTGWSLARVYWKNPGN